MSLSVLSFNFKTTPIEMREKLDVSAEKSKELLPEIQKQCRLDEIMIVSTCNRVEFYYTDDDSGEGGERLTAWLKQHFGATSQELAQSAVLLTSRAALNHLFRVASSLESMVLGEPQVLGQVKEAYQQIIAQNCHGPLLSGLMPSVFRAAKRVRSETQIARFPVSVSFVAVQLAGRIFETLENKTVMVIGAGEMAELTVSHLLRAGINRLLITNRTFTRAVELAERFQGSAVRFEELDSCLSDADIVISSTGAQEFVITPDLARQAVKKRRGEPIFLIDIAVPRDVDPEVNNLANVYSYDIDDLQAVADANKQEREGEALQAQKIIEEELDQYEQRTESLSIVPTVKSLRQQFSEMGERELEQTLSQLSHLSVQDATQVRKLVRRLVNKLLHIPSSRLKKMGDEINGTLYVEALTALFDLHPEPTEDGKAEPSEESHAAVAGGDSGKVVRLHITPPKKNRAD